MHDVQEEQQVCKDNDGSSTCDVRRTAQGLTVCVQHRRCNFQPAHKDVQICIGWLAMKLSFESQDIFRGLRRGRPQVNGSLDLQV